MGDSYRYARNTTQCRASRPDLLSLWLRAVAEYHRAMLMLRLVLRGKVELDLRDGLARVQVLRAGLAAVHDGVTAVDLEGVVEELEPLLLLGVPAVGQPAIRLQQHCGTQVLVGVPPVGRTRGGTARAQPMRPIRYGHPPTGGALGKRGHRQASLCPPW